ncbi:hypothetical protein [Lacticaseibacillus mingshuiensis]|uniref:Uncharacterized protein n=1 Tax=Lacticaseibacillus mingshuiensis TaxID=2799574 RepID=A0ABW4CG34_9LACO|nr:hypothetical protein [Lacticaseibacillus mingshuiensis]
MTKKRWEDEQLGGPMPRPWWLDDDVILNRNRQPGEPVLMKISALTPERFRKYQANGGIPADYKIEDWIKS